MFQEGQNAFLRQLASSGSIPSAHQSHFLPAQRATLRYLLTRVGLQFAYPDVVRYIDRYLAVDLAQAVCRCLGTDYRALNEKLPATWSAPSEIDVLLRLLITDRQRFESNQVFTILCLGCPLTLQNWKEKLEICGEINSIMSELSHSLQSYAHWWKRGPVFKEYWGRLILEDVLHWRRFAGQLQHYERLGDRLAERLPAGQAFRSAWMGEGLAISRKKWRRLSPAEELARQTGKLAAGGDAARLFSVSCRGLCDPVPALRLARLDE